MPFRSLGERDVYAWKAFRLVEADFEAPDGERFSRTFLRHPGAVAVVAIDGDDVVLVRQYRAAFGGEMLEIPAGTMDKGSTESPEACARRELAEEIGATAAELRPLATYAVAAGISDERIHLFVADGLQFGERMADGVEEQSMTVERMALADAPARIASGEIADGKTIVGLLLALRSTVG